MSSIATRPTSFDELVFSSPYYNIIESNKQYYYNIYLEKCKRDKEAKDSYEFTSKDLLKFVGGEGAEFDENEDGSIRYYSTQSGGNYNADPNGQFVKVTTASKDGQPGTVNYIHYSQVFVPIDCVRQAMDIFAIVMAVTFQNTLLQMAKLEAYVLEAEKVNAKLSELNALYAQINLYQSQTQDTRGLYAVAETAPDFIAKLMKTSIITGESKIITGMDPAPLAFAVPFYSWSSFGWNFFSLATDKDGKVIAKRIGDDENRGGDAGKKYDTEQGVKDHFNGVTPSEANKAASMVSGNDLVKLLSNGITEIEFPASNANANNAINPYSEFYLTRTELIHDNWDKYVPKVPIEEQKGASTEWRFQYWPKTASAKNMLGSREVVTGDMWGATFKADLNVQDFALREGPIDIVKGDKKSYINMRDFSNYADQLRIQIEDQNNQLQMASNYISMANGDMQTNFNMATDVIAALGSQLLMTGRNIRI